MKKHVAILFTATLFILYCSPVFANMLPPLWTVSVNVENDIFLTWEMPKGSAKTIIYRKNKDEGKFTQINDKALGFYVDKGVKKGVWIYRLQAEDTYGNLSEFSTERIIIVKEKKRLTYTPPVWGESFVDEESVLLRWSDTNDVPVVAYNLYKKVDGEKAFKLIASEPSIKSFKDAMVEVGQKVIYKLCPIGADSSELGCSEPLELRVEKRSERKRKRVLKEFLVRKTKLLYYLTLPDEMSFDSPTDIKVDKVGKIYVADTGTGLIYVFKYSGEYEKTLGLTYNDDGTIEKFDNLLGIDVDDEGFVYGVDAYKGILRVYDQRNKLVLKIDLPTVFLEYEEYNFKKYGLVDVSVDNKTKTINIVDNYNSHIYRFNKKGELLGVYLEKGQNHGQVHNPTFSYIDKNGRILLSDTMNQKIVVFSPNMKPELEFGTSGDILGSFIRAKGIATDNKGDIYIADSFANSVQIFSPNGRFKYALGNHIGKRPDIVTPNGIYVDKRNKIYFVEKLINRIQVRQLTDQFVKFKPKQKKKKVDK